MICIPLDYGKNMPLGRESQGTCEGYLLDFFSLKYYSSTFLVVQYLKTVASHGLTRIMVSYSGITVSNGCSLKAECRYP